MVRHGKKLIRNLPESINAGKNFATLQTADWLLSTNSLYINRLNMFYYSIECDCMYMCMYMYMGGSKN